MMLLMYYYCIWAEWIFSLGLVQNRGDSLTFIRGDSRSYIDVTITTSSIPNRIKNWRLSPEESLSLQKYIFYEIEESKPRRNNAQRSRITVNLEIFTNVFTILKTKIRKSHTNLIDVIKEAQNASTSQMITTPNKQPYWWNDTTSNLRIEYNKLKRGLQREKTIIPRNEQIITKLERKYKDARNKYKKSIVQLKQNHWKQVCTETENDVFCQGYKIVTRQLKHAGAPFALHDERKAEITRDLFPISIHDRYVHLIFPICTPFTTEEVKAVAVLLRLLLQLKPNKAPGPDGVASESVKMAINESPEEPQGVFNELLKRQIFPTK
ncbi:hypothetical protein JTB14_000011 [Gonioctena quinquepunctata]|nr:hypothetical protein JTB14_000011 [Gonioctena quinquepunctata]